MADLVDFCITNLEGGTLLSYPQVAKYLGLDRFSCFFSKSVTQNLFTVQKGEY